MDKTDLKKWGRVKTLIWTCYRQVYDDVHWHWSFVRHYSNQEYREYLKTDVIVYFARENAYYVRDLSTGSIYMFSTGDVP
jgi:hypothetical protein